jgi:hypothetical protein
LENREQGRAKPNPRAAALVLVRRYPDTPTAFALIQIN